MDVYGELEYAELVLDGVLSGRVSQIYEESDTIAGMMGMCGDRVEWVSGDSIGADTVAGMQFIGKAIGAVWNLIWNAISAVLIAIAKLFIWLFTGGSPGKSGIAGTIYEKKITPAGGWFGKRQVKEDYHALRMRRLAEHSVAVNNLTASLIEPGNAIKKELASANELIKQLDKIKKDQDADNKTLDKMTDDMKALLKAQADEKKDIVSGKTVAVNTPAKSDFSATIKVTDELREAFKSDFEYLDKHAVANKGTVRPEENRKVMHDLTGFSKKALTAAGALKDIPKDFDRIIKSIEAKKFESAGKDQKALVDKVSSVSTGIANAVGLDLDNAGEIARYADKRGGLSSTDLGGGKFVRVSSEEIKAIPGLYTFSVSVIEPKDIIKVKQLIIEKGDFDEDVISKRHQDMAKDLKIHADGFEAVKKLVKETNDKLTAYTKGMEKDGDVPLSPLLRAVGNNVKEYVNTYPKLSKVLTQITTAMQHDGNIKLGLLSAIAADGKKDK